MRLFTWLKRKEAELFRQLEIWWLRRQMAKMYGDFAEYFEAYDCGRSLALFLSPDYQAKIQRLGRLIERLSRLDPRCPAINPITGDPV